MEINDVIEFMDSSAEDYEENEKMKFTNFTNETESDDIPEVKLEDFSDDEIEEMNDDEFDELMENDVVNLDDLSEEEILSMQKQFATLTDEGKELLRDIQGIQNSRIITLNALLYNSAKVIREADDNVEDIEFSESYLEFITWYDYKIKSGEFYPMYSEHEKVFEDIINSGLENEDDNNIFAYFKKKYIEKVKGKVAQIEEPMSSLEVEAARRFEKLSTTNKSLIKIFENIISYKDMKWDEFESKVLDDEEEF